MASSPPSLFNILSSFPRGFCLFCIFSSAYVFFVRGAQVVYVHDLFFMLFSGVALSIRHALFLCYRSLLLSIAYFYGVALSIRCPCMFCRTISSFLFSLPILQGVFFYCFIHQVCTLLLLEKFLFKLFLKCCH